MTKEIATATKEVGKLVSIIKRWNGIDENDGGEFERVQKNIDNLAKACAAIDCLMPLSLPHESDQEHSWAGMVSKAQDTLAKALQASLKDQDAQMNRVAKAIDDLNEFKKFTSLL